MDHETQKKLIGQRLNTVLAMRRIRQKDLAQALGIQDNAVSYFCKGDRTPNTVQLAQICRYLDVSADYLLGLSDVMSSSLTVQEIVRTTGLSEENTKTLVVNHRENPVDFSPELCNFLLSCGLDSDLAIPFEQMLLALQLPSAVRCAKVLTDELPKNPDVPDLIRMKAIYSGTEAYFNRGAESDGRLVLSPEEAFRYYTDRIADEIRRQLNAAYEPRNQWGNLDGIREDLMHAVLEREKALMRQSCPEQN